MAVEWRSLPSPTGEEWTARAPGVRKTTFPVKKPTRRPSVPPLSPSPRHGPRPPRPNIFPLNPSTPSPLAYWGPLPVHFFLVGEGKEARDITWAGGVTSQEEGREGSRVGAADTTTTTATPSCLPTNISPRALHASPTTIFCTFQRMAHDRHAGAA